MSTNSQLQKVTPSRIRRIRHRRRLIAGNLAGRHPGLDNFLTRESTRANAIGGISNVDEDRLLTAIRGVGFGTLNRNIIDSFDVQTTAQTVNAGRTILNYTSQGIAIT